MNPFLTLFAVLFSTAATASTDQQPSADKFFGEPIKLNLDQSSLPWDYSAGGVGTYSVVHVLDLNDDGLKDIVFHSFDGEGWRRPEGDYGRIDNSLMVFLQNSSSFELSNELITGNKLIDLSGGFPRKSKQGDFNGDGYPDVAFGLTREDGRQNVPGNENWKTAQAAFVSNGDGTYRVDSFDIVSAGHSMSVASNGLGNLDIVYSGGRAVRYGPQGWVRVDDAFPTQLDTWTFDFLPSDEDGKTSDWVVTTGRDDGTLEAYKKSNDSWEIVKTYSMTANTISAQVLREGSVTTEELYLFDNYLYLNPFPFEDSCTLFLGNGEYAWVFYNAAAGVKFDPERSDPISIEQLEGVGLGRRFLIRVIDDQVTLSSNVFPDQEVGPNNERWQYCEDINGDGYDDVVTQNFRPQVVEEDYVWKPFDIYLNKKDGTFEKFDTLFDPDVEFLSFSDAFDHARYADLNGDGINDLIVFISGWNPDDPYYPFTMEVRFGTRPIFSDEDDDGYINALDIFPNDPEEWADTDLDGVGDNADQFPDDSSESADTDGDGLGNNADSDDDGDSYPDEAVALTFVSATTAGGASSLNIAIASDAGDGEIGFNISFGISGWQLNVTTAIYEWEEQDLPYYAVAEVIVNILNLIRPDFSTYSEAAAELQNYFSNRDNILEVREDAFPRDASEWLDSDSDGIGNNADFDDDNDGFTDEEELADGTNPLSRFSCRSGCFSFDIDENKEAKALTDGLLVIRHLFGFTGSALANGAVAGNADRNTADAITSFLLEAETELDIDGNGESKALSDGLLLIRYLFGFTGDALVAGAVGDGAARNTSEAIEDYIKARVPASE